MTGPLVASDGSALPVRMVKREGGEALVEVDPEVWERLQEAGAFHTAGTDLDCRVDPYQHDVGRQLHRRGRAQRAEHRRRLGRRNIGFAEHPDAGLHEHPAERGP